MEVVDARDGVPIKPNDEVAFADSSIGRSAIPLYVADEDAAIIWKVEVANDLSTERDSLPVEPEVASADSSLMK